MQGEVGFLALDRNKNNRIDDISEMFSEFNNANASSGLGALALLDSDQNGSLDQQDDAWGDLRVWIDRNTDAFTDQEELIELSVLGISKLNLHSEETTENDKGGGAHIVRIGSYETEQGVSRELVEAMFTGIEFEGVA